MLSVTHELKSPLASIKLYLQTILKRDLEKEKRDQFIRSSIDDIGRLDDLVENMLLATKIEKIKKFPLQMNLPKPNQPKVDLLTYRDLLWKSRFVTLPVFKNEVINFSEESKYLR